MLFYRLICFLWHRCKKFSLFCAIFLRISRTRQNVFDFSTWTVTCLTQSKKVNQIIKINFSLPFKSTVHFCTKWPKFFKETIFQQKLFYFNFLLTLNSLTFYINKARACMFLLKDCSAWKASKKFLIRRVSYNLYIYLFEAKLNVLSYIIIYI